MKRSKRRLIKNFGLSLAFLLANNFFPLKKIKANYKPRVVIIGLGFGGTSCLRILSELSEKLDIIVIERKKKIQTCPFSNHVIGGSIKYTDIIFELDNIKKMNVKFVDSSVNFVDSSKKEIKFFDGSSMYFDFLILSPGIGFKWNKIEGHLEDDLKQIPHCWDGNKNLLNFIGRLNDLENNSRIVISAPDYPYRCPPAPYERASMIASYLKKRGKSFKILILDSKNSFTKKDIFLREWEKIYDQSIEWISKKNGGEVKYLDQKNKYVSTEDGNKFSADFIHIIPEQRAADIVVNSNLTNNDWCQISPIDFELIDHKDIYVLGDSINAGAMPKSAFSADSQAKILALNLINKISDQEYVNPVFLNTCYSFSSLDRAFSITSWYKLNSDKDRIVSLGTSQSSENASKKERYEESIHALGWYKNITDYLYG